MIATNLFFQHRRNSSLGRFLEKTLGKPVGRWLVALALLQALPALAQVVPAVPTAIAPSGAIASANPTYTWNAAAGATAYLFWIGTGSSAYFSVNFSAAELGCASGTGICSITPATPLVAGTTYTWNVKASNGAGSSATSNSLTTTRVSTAVLAAPTALAPSGVITTINPTYSWNASAGATAYLFWIGTGSSAYFSVNFSASELGCASGSGMCSVNPATPLARDITYTWNVKAVNSAGTSLVSNSKSTIVTSATNQLPAANAGVDKVITLPTNSVSLAGSGSDQDGTISAYTWSKLSGGGATLTGANTATLSLASLAAGSYMFRLSVTDNSGGSAFDDIQITVNPATGLLAPTTIAPSGAIATANPTYSWNASAGATSYLFWIGTDSSAYFSVNFSATELGCASGTGICSIAPATPLAANVTYAWNVRALNSTATSPLSDSKNTTLTTNTNRLPTANAGLDRSITLPTSSLNLTGSGTDTDGTITAFSWTKVSGGDASLAGANTATLSLSSLAVGTYVFRLFVADNSGGTAADDVNVLVSAAPLNSSPSVSITAPTNGATAIVGAAVTIQAVAADSDGTISKVEFYQGTTLLGTDTTNPYAQVWSNAGLGNHALTARAYDNLSASKTSAVVNLTIVSSNPNPGIPIRPTFPSAAAIYPDAQQNHTDFPWLKFSFTGPEIVINADGSETATGPVRTLDLPYNFWKPDNYNSGAAFPLVIFLHGADEKGGWGDSPDPRTGITGNGNGWQLWTIFNHGISQFVSGYNRTNFPIFLAGIQCCTNGPYGGYDEPNVDRMIQLLIADLKSKYNIDSSRIYVTGLSMGAAGAYYQVARHPDVYAAAIGLSFSLPDNIVKTNLKNKPIWSFCGASDGNCGNNVAQSQHLEMGGTHILTRYDGGGHDANVWKAAYGTQHLLPWLLSQRLNNPMPEAGPGQCLPTSPAGMSYGQTYSLTTDYPQFSGYYWSSPNFALASLTGMRYLLNRNGGSGGLYDGVVTNPGATGASWSFAPKVAEPGSYSLGLVCKVNSSFNPAMSGNTTITTRINMTH